MVKARLLPYRKVLPHTPLPGGSVAGGEGACALGHHRPELARLGGDGDRGQHEPVRTRTRYRGLRSRARRQHPEPGIHEPGHPRALEADEAPEGRASRDQVRRQRRDRAALRLGH